jgi:hypothetical protein
MRRIVVAVLMAASGAACGPRRVEVGAAAPSAAAVQLNVTNTLGQPVNIYVVESGSATFVRQVNANVTETVPVRGVAAGSTVTLRAVPVDGRNTYTRDNVVLSGSYDWRVP